MTLPTMSASATSPPSSRGWQAWHAVNDQVSMEIPGFRAGATAVAAVELAVVGGAGTAVVTGVELVVIAAAA